MTFARSCFRVAYNRDISNPSWKVTVLEGHKLKQNEIWKVFKEIENLHVATTPNSLTPINTQRPSSERPTSRRVLQLIWLRGFYSNVSTTSKTMNICYWTNRVYTVSNLQNSLLRILKYRKHTTQRIRELNGGIQTFESNVFSEQWKGDGYEKILTHGNYS